MQETLKRSSLLTFSPKERGKVHVALKTPKRLTGFTGITVLMELVEFTSLHKILRNHSLF